MWRLIALGKKTPNKAKNEKTFQHPEQVKVKQSQAISNPVIPTADRRHITAVREGTISGEAFCRDAKRRRELGLHSLPVVEDDFSFLENLRS
jgi:hypothetical protein